MKVPFVSAITNLVEKRRINSMNLDIQAQELLTDMEAWLYVPAVAVKRRALQILKQQEKDKLQILRQHDKDEFLKVEGAMGCNYQGVDNIL